MRAEPAPRAAPNGISHRRTSTILSSNSCARSNVGAISSASSASRFASSALPARKSPLRGRSGRRRDRPARRPARLGTRAARRRDPSGRALAAEHAVRRGVERIEHRHALAREREARARRLPPRPASSACGAHRRSVWSCASSASSSAIARARSPAASAASARRKRALSGPVARGTSDAARSSGAIAAAASLAGNQRAAERELHRVAVGMLCRGCAHGLASAVARSLRARAALLRSPRSARRCARENDVCSASIVVARAPWSAPPARRARRHRPARGAPALRRRGS